MPYFAISRQETNIFDLPEANGGKDLRENKYFSPTKEACFSTESRILWDSDRGSKRDFRVPRHVADDKIKHLGRSCPNRNLHLSACSVVQDVGQLRYSHDQERIYHHY
jgi:hypothetical protein